MSYSMHSPPTQGYPNPVNDVYTSRAYPGHLMSPGTMNNYSPGYLRGDHDPYSNAALQYSNGVGAGLQPGSGSAHYSSTTANHHHQQQHPQSHHSSISSHHTYPGSMNHFGHQHHQQQQQDVYNSCVGSTRNSNSYPTTTATSLNIARNSAMNAKSYWSCDPSLSQPSQSNHCYPQAAAAAAAAAAQQVQHNSPHNKTAPTPNWNRSPNIIHSPTSSTPSPIPCPPTTPHPFGSSPHHAHSVESSSSKPPPPPPYNGQIIPSHATNLNNGPTNANINNCNNSNTNNNSNPLQSLQKMVQIDSSETNDDIRNHYDSCSTTTSSTPTATVPTMAIVNHHGQHQLNPPPPSTTITHSINSSSLDSNDVNNYPTYYNLDQNRLCATPQTVYPTNSNISSAQSSNVPFKTNSHSPPESRSVVVGASSRENNANKQQEKLNNDSSDIRICSMRFSQNKLNRTVTTHSSKNNSSDTCSNESPTAQSVNHKMSATGTTNSIPESMIHADQTHDSLNSFRGSETTANSRDSLKSSDSDAVSSYTVSQCSTPNNSTSNANTWKSGGNNFLTNSPNKSWWSENSLPQTISADCNQTSYSGPNVNYSRMSQSNPSSNHPSSWSQHMAISNQSSPMLANHHHHHHHHHQSSYGSQMDGIVKKKRGRPFGSKNRRSLDTTPIPNNSNNPLIDPNKIRKRKSILVDIGINTNLSFDVQASWNRDDDSMKFSSQQQDVAPSIQHQHSIPPAMVANNKRNKKVAGPVIRIDKLEKNDEKFSIVNNSLKTQDEERDSKFAKSHHHHHHYQSKISSEIGMLSRKNNYSTTKKSFLSSNHSHNNSCNSEKNWFCILCHKGPHYKSLGDLYGPYFITYEHSSQPILNVDNLESSSQDELKTSGPSSWLENNHHPEKNDTTTTNANETTASTSASEKRSLRKRPMDLNNSDDHNHNRKNKSNSSTNNNQFNEINNNGSSSSTKIESEVWIHEDCIVWSNNVYLEGSKIRNLEPAIVESFENICTKCKQPGATLGCIYKNCTVSPLHYLCAKEKDCDLDEEKFILSCSKHKKRRILPKDTDDNDKKINDEDVDIVENIEDVDPSQENL